MWIHFCVAAKAWQISSALRNTSKSESSSSSSSISSKDSVIFFVDLADVVDALEEVEGLPNDVDDLHEDDRRSVDEDTCRPLVEDAVR